MIGRYQQSYWVGRRAHLNNRFAVWPTDAGLWHAMSLRAPIVRMFWIHDMFLFLGFMNYRHIVQFLRLPAYGLSRFS